MLFKNITRLKATTPVGDTRELVVLRRLAGNKTGNEENNIYRYICIYDWGFRIYVDRE